MKILQVGKFYPPVYGGIESVMFDLTEGLNDSEIKCDVICSNNKNTFEVSNFKKYKVFRTALWMKLFSTSITPQMYFKLKKIMNEYDILEIHLPDPMVNLVLYLLNPKMKIILYWHSDIIKQKKLLKLYEPLQKWLINRADVVIGATPIHLEKSSYYDLFKKKAVVIPYGINDQMEINKDYKDLKNIYKNKKIIFSIGRLVYYKGFEYLIESAKYLPDDYLILIGGTGELKNILKKQINDLELNNKVILLGRIEENDLWNYYSSCDLFCLPSIYRAEMFGIVQLEAMMFGKPIVSTKIENSGVPFVNKDNETGYCVEPKNSKALSEAFIKILSDKMIYTRFSKNSLNRFKTNFKRNIMIEKHIKLYKEIIK